ncbi:unnamed protein product [Symbiodinium natans]|uniref:Lipid-binding serum glycoprotein C-terminal domain-containing protein n=1 Tax=Symbiodinium natans TaxID=878477 RepID=A0A812G2V6_9DINO|nr:unnamed protein product [Symbiodinium natans]
MDSHAAAKCPEKAGAMRMTSPCHFAPLVRRLTHLLAWCSVASAAAALGRDAHNCEVANCEEDSALLQLTSHNRASPTLEQGPMRSNAELWATYSGLDFMLNQSKDFVAHKIVQAPLMAGQTVSAGFGISLQIGHLIATTVPAIQFISPVWTEAGVRVSVEVTGLQAKADLKVSSPESEGELLVNIDGLFEGNYNIAVVDERITVGVGSLVTRNLHVQPKLELSCVSPGFWSSVPCAAISALNGNVPGWLVDTILFFTRSHVEELLQNIIEQKLDANLRSLPDKLQVFSSNATNVQLAFTPLGILQSYDLKAASYHVLAEGVPQSDEEFPVPGLLLQNHSTTSMFAMAFSSSVPNSLFAVLHDSGVLSHTIFPQDLPNNSMFGLDTFSLELAFYCPWLKTVYAFECPFWQPCPVSATIQTSARPVIDLSDGLSLTIPLSVDFHLLKEASEPTFLWRLNTTATGTLQPSMVHLGPCDQLLKATLEELHTSWFEVTKSKDDSWVATALSINLFLPMLINGPLLDQINAHLDEGIPLKPIAFGGSRYALSNSSVNASSGRFILSSNVWLADSCP